MRQNAKTLKFPSTNVSTATTLNRNSSIVLLDNSAGLVELVVTLPDATAADMIGKVYEIKAVDIGSNGASIATTGGQTIDGATTYTFTYNNEYVKVVSNGVNWFLMADKDLSGAIERRTSGQTNLNTLTPQILQLQTAIINTNPELYTEVGNTVTINRDGVYDVASNIYISSPDPRTNPSVVIYVNGIEQGVTGASGYIRDNQGHNESSVHVRQLLSLSAGDVVDVRCTRLANNGVVEAVADRGNLIIKKI